MPEVIVVGSFTAQAGKEAEAEDAMSGLVAPTHAEEGCILYALHRGTDDPRRLTFIERWQSRELLDAHLSSRHVQDFLKLADDLLEPGGEIVVYEPLPGGEERKGSLAAHAGG